MKHTPGHPSDQSISSAWQEGVSEASTNAAFKQALLQQEGELLHSFADHYEKLKALPRRMRRALQRQWKRSLAGIALILALGMAPALAATINVRGSCTLGRAITSANDDIAVGGCTRGRGADRIVLPANSTQTLTAGNNNVYGPTGLPVIRSEITIAGNGSTIRRVPTAPDFRIFAVAGDLTLRRATVSGGATSGRGGGTYINPGLVTLVNCVVTGNRTSLSGGGVGAGADTQPLTIINSTISGVTELAWAAAWALRKTAARPE